MRYLSQFIEKFTSNKFLLLSGPRQVGKTTLAKEWLDPHNGEYLNWDLNRHRKKILNIGSSDLFSPSYVVIDELHKYTRWKNFLKGLYDTQKDYLKILVTGSAKLDVYQKSGDSMFGRYEYLRLHPYSIGELTHKKTLNHITNPPKKWVSLSSKDYQFNTWLRLKSNSGFPEPYHKNSTLLTNRWSARRRGLLINEDLRDLSQVRSIGLVEHLAILLPERVGSPLSLNSLREELQVAHDTVKNWLEMLERLYYCFSITPFHKQLNRSLKKERKFYLWDWSEIEDPGARYENMVASHLLKSIHLWNDLGYGNYSLHYWRNQDKEEVDFIVCNKMKPLVAIECNLSETGWHKPLTKVSEAVGGIEEILLIDQIIEAKVRDKQKICSAVELLGGLN